MFYCDAEKTCRCCLDINHQRYLVLWLSGNPVLAMYWIHGWTYQPESGAAWYTFAKLAEGERSILMKIFSKIVEHASLLSSPSVCSSSWRISESCLCSVKGSCSMAIDASHTRHISGLQLVPKRTVPDLRNVLHGWHPIPPAPSQLSVSR